MPYKQRLIDFMRRKASFLPVELQSVYWREEDEEAIKDNWENIVAYRVCKKIFENFENTKYDDMMMCAPCVAAAGNCNKCTYFTLHGCCKTSHSDYSFVVDRIFGVRDVEKGIMDYIKEKCGDQAIEQLRKIIAADYNSFGPPNPPGGDGEPVALAA